MPNSDDDQPIEVDPRVRFAAERTLLAWIRTGLAMMGFGFVVARFGLFLRELAAIKQHQPAASAKPSLALGMLLIGMGILINLLAAGQHHRFLRQLRRAQPLRIPDWSMGVVVALVMALIGLATSLYLAISDW